MRLVKRAVHIDFHTMPDIPDFAANFDAKKFAQTLKDAKVDYVNVFAKCNIGFAYYPTKIGIMHPYLDFDMFGQTVEECHKLGIGVTAYFNTGLDHEMARKHREWLVVNKEGQIIYDDRTANFFRNMCFNSGYREYMLAMIKEVVDNYPVDGVFLDCMATIFPCYGNECAESMRERGMDPLNDDDVAKFTKESIIDFSREVKKIVGNEKFLYLNGLYPGDAEGLRTHAEIECLPGAWSYDFFPAQVAYARNLGQQAWYMTGRFHACWGDFGGLKSKASLENDCWDAISNAVSTSVGDHMHPRDGLDPVVYKMIGEVYTEIEKYEPWTDYAKAVADIGILATADGILGDNHSGAARMLGELKYTYDIINENMDMSKYKVIILPDNIIITSKLKGKLQAHLDKGGSILSSGYSGLNTDKTKFEMEAWNMDYEGADPWNSSYFKMLEDSNDDIPDILCGIYSQGIFMQLKEGSKAIADYYQPYFNRKWDGFHGYFYTPPEKYAGRPAIAKSGNIIQICFNIFTAYYQYAYVVHKNVIKHCLKQLLCDPVVKYENLPSTSRVTVTEKDNMRMIHVKLTHPEQRGKYNVIEDRPVLSGAVVYLKDNGIKSVYIAPDRKPLRYELMDGYVKIDLPTIDGYIMVVVE